MGSLSCLRRALRCLPLYPPRAFAPPLRPRFLSPPLISAPFSTSSRRKKGAGSGAAASDDDDEDAVGRLFLFRSDPDRPPKLFVLQPRLRPDSLLDSKLSEALNLANSLEELRDGFYSEEFASKSPPPHLVVQNPAARSARAHADTYFGPGTVDNIKCHLRALEAESGIDAIFVNGILSGIQQRNLEVAWGRPVLDRVGLIIEIFNAHAQTKEAKLQAELAALMYMKTRLVRVRGPGGRLTFGPGGEAEVVSARGRGSGGRGFISGAGETELHLQRRRIQERRTRLLSQIDEVRRTRALQRYARKRRGGSYGQGLATVAVVGYTNAGKSTLVSALSEADLYRDDRLFATVDPRLRSVVLPSGRKAILSDTVGFISDLPVQLVEAFHATLEEVVEADLLVHVLDSSAPNLEEHRSAVLQVLQQIGVSEDKIQNMIEVWNKVDLLDENMVADGFPSDVDCLAENEESEVFSETEGDLASDMSSSEPTNDDGESSGHLSEETVYDFDDMASDLSSCDVINYNISVSELSSSSMDSAENICDPQAEDLKDRATLPTPPSCHIKTSAVLGIGLQELLTLIEEKLNEQRTVVQRNYGPFDRKWRPSHGGDDQRAVEQ